MGRGDEAKDIVDELRDLLDERLVASSGLVLLGLLSEVVDGYGKRKQTPEHATDGADPEPAE
jgi:hypothetical protein